MHPAFLVFSTKISIWCTFNINLIFSCGFSDTLRPCSQRAYWCIHPCKGDVLSRARCTGVQCSPIHVNWSRAASPDWYLCRYCSQMQSAFRDMHPHLQISDCSVYLSAGSTIYVSWDSGCTDAATTFQLMWMGLPALSAQNTCESPAGKDGSCIGLHNDMPRVKEALV